YVREAARAAAELNSPQAEKAMLVALGVFLDNTDTLRSFPATRPLVAEVENTVQRNHRLQVLGTPTMQGRPDLAKHFFVSANILALVGPGTANSVGLAKELVDADGDSGFSFADMSANRAGVHFGQRVLGGKLLLPELARTFRGSDFMPEIA